MPMGGVIALLVVFGLPLALVFLLSQDDPSPTEPGPCADARRSLNQLEPKAKEYAAASGTPTGGRPLVSGGIVPMDGNRIDERVYCALAGKLQARSPEQVGTVVSIDYGERVTGHYTTGGDAIVIVARLRIVDLGSGKEYSPREEFVGSDPPYSVESPGGGKVNGYGDPPTQQIVKYLESLAGGGG